MRRLAVLLCLCAFAPITAAHAAGTSSWAQAQIKLDIRHQIFKGTAATFRPQAPLTRGTLARAIAKLTDTPERHIVGPATPVSLEELDRKLVRAVGLGDTAYRFYLGARKAGLQPPKRFGTETVARLIGLRINHPVGQDYLELQPQQTATRAEAAYSLAQVVRFENDQAQQWPVPSGHIFPSTHHWHGFGGYGYPRLTQAASRGNIFATSWEVESLKSEVQSFDLPKLTRWQRRILGAAFSYIGYPYIWGGTGQGTPGFDCSGFVWRVYKLTAYSHEGDLASTLRGRTTYEMSGEVPARERIGFKNLQPGDVLFFGKGPHSSPSVVDHTGIYIGNGWFINSSNYGVALAQLTGWARSSFAWARRPLREAGLE